MRTRRDARPAGCTPGGMRCRGERCCVLPRLGDSDRGTGYAATGNRGPKAADLKEESMPTAAAAAAAPPRGRLIAGVAILLFWFGAKVLGPIIIVNTDLSVEAKALASVVLFFGVAKICLIAIILVLGKPGFAYLKATIFKGFGHAFSKVAPDKVGPVRYRIGLVMFTVPLLLAWVVPHLEDVSPRLAEQDRPLDWVMELIFMASFFVLGGDFWAKCRALFVREAVAVFPAAEATGVAG